MKKLKKVISLACAAATLCSVGVISASAYTRRLYGDVNGDGVISRADAELTQRASMGLETLDTYQQIAADVNGDGIIDLTDAYTIYKFVEGLYDEFPVGVYFVY